MASGLFHLMVMNVGMVVRRPIWSFADTCPPSEYESVPAEASLYSNCMKLTVKFFTTGVFKSQDNFSLKPSGLMSGSPVT